MKLSVLVPELNANQLKALERLIAEEVIGKTPQGIEIDRELIELRVRDEQRQRLQQLIYGEEV